MVKLLYHELHMIQVQHEVLKLQWNKDYVELVMAHFKVSTWRTEGNHEQLWAGWHPGRDSNKVILKHELPLEPHCLAEQ
jgi:hypothetical protein